MLALKPKSSLEGPAQASPHGLPFLSELLDILSSNDRDHQTSRRESNRALLGTSLDQHMVLHLGPSLITPSCFQSW